MKLELEQHDYGFRGKLKCPSCDGEMLHHEKVEVFECEEDKEKGLHVAVEKGIVKTDTNLSDNPSDRRYGIKIHFLCEGCETRPVLSISQHKGNTLIDLN